MMTLRVWRMDFDNRFEKVLYVDEGALEIMRASGSWSEMICDDNGEVIDVVHGHSLCEELIVPSSVVKINDCAFIGMASLKKISILENVTVIGKDAFKNCDSLTCVVAPKVSLKTIKENSTKLILARGYLSNKALYSEEISEEYEQFIKKNKKKLSMVAQKYEVDENQLFYGTLVRGKKESIEQFIKEQLNKVQIYEKMSIGDEILLKLNCRGYQIDCQADGYKDLGFVIFTTLGNSASMFVKKAGDVVLKDYNIGEVDGNIECLQIFNVCPDKNIHEKYILTNSGMGIEFKYQPSKYIVSMVNDEVIDYSVSDKPLIKCKYLDNPEEKLYDEGYICIE